MTTIRALILFVFFALAPWMTANGQPMAESGSAPPVYPRDELIHGIGGRVVLLVVVDAKGVASRVNVASSSGNRHLDQAAVDASKTWHFHPTMRRGKAVAGVVRVPVVFDPSDH